MRRVRAVALTFMLLTAYTSQSEAQNARERQAAAQAYDRGTTAYVDQAYEEAARWFETANRLAPAAPALMQAIRAHERSENLARAATLALELQTTYQDDGNATSFARSVLDKHAPSLLRVSVVCDEDCKLDLDGKLEEHLTFFVNPQQPHQLTATFMTGSRSAELRGAPGETKELSFEAPAAPPIQPVASDSERNKPARDASSSKPLDPIVTWIGLGVTVALGAATVVSGLEALGKVPAYERAATEFNKCKAAERPDCTAQGDEARRLLNNGLARETRTNVLIGVTAAAAVGTGVLAFFFTDWSGDSEKAQNASSRHHWFVGLHVTPQPGGAATVLEGRF